MTKNAGQEKNAASQPGEGGNDAGLIQSIFRATPIGIGMVHERVITRVNKWLCELTGYSDKEMLGRNSRFLYPTDEEYEFVGREKYQQIARHGVGTVETRWKRKDGTIIDVLLSSSPIDPADLSQGVTFTAMDITNRKHTEAALKLSEERFRCIIEFAPFGIHMYAMNNEGRLVFTGANPAADRILKTDNRQFIGKTIEEAFPPLVQTDIPRHYREAAEQGIPWHTEQVSYDHERIAGAFVVDAFQTAPGRMAAAFWDVTELRNAQAQRDRLAAAVEQAAESIMITDAQGVIVYANPFFEAMTGYSASEALGKTPRILSSGKQSDEFYKEMWETIIKGQTWRGVIINKRKDGVLFEEQVAISPVFDSIGRIVNYVAVKRDVTQEHLLENQVRQTQKMVAIGQLAHRIAHDFTNVLTIVHGVAQLVRNKPGQSLETCQHMNSIIEASNRIAVLTGELLSFAHPAPLSLRPMALDRAVAGVEAILKQTIGHEVTLEFDTSRKCGKVSVDPSQIEQAVVHMAINALEAMPHGGRLSIRTEPVGADNRELASILLATQEKVRTPADYAAIVVEDTGCGMSEEVKARIFEPFFSTKKEKRSTGLGLSTVYRIVEQHNGFITVDSAPGAGTTFRVYLPLIRMA